MSSFFSALFGKPEAPKMGMAKPQVSAVPEVEGAKDVSKFMKKRKGQGATVLTGALEPMDVGMRTLLG